MSWDYPRTTRICDYLHKLIPGCPRTLIPGCPGIIPGCPGISKDNSDLGYPGITQPWDSRISQPWDSRICGYLHRLIPGCPGITPGCSGIIPGQLRPRIFRDYPGITHPWDSRITQPWDSRICGYLHKLIPGCPGIIPGLSQDNSMTIQSWESPWQSNGKIVIQHGYTTLLLSSRNIRMCTFVWLPE